MADAVLPFRKREPAPSTHDERYACPSGCRVTVDGLSTDGYCAQCGEELLVITRAVYGTLLDMPTRVRVQKIKIALIVVCVAIAWWRGAFAW